VLSGGLRQHQIYRRVQIAAAKKEVHIEKTFSPHGLVRALNIGLQSGSRSATVPHRRGARSAGENEDPERSGSQVRAHAKVYAGPDAKNWFGRDFAAALTKVREAHRGDLMEK
jgi:hypothetical protein